MNKPWVGILLMILVALQAVTVTADAHQFHQSQYRHLELNVHAEDDSHFTQETEIESTEKSHASSAADKCQHCCHCHGSFHAVFSSSTLNLFAAPAQKAPTYLCAFSSAQPTTLFRPPKA